MRKVFLPDIKGKDCKYWDSNWKSQQIEEAVRYCDVDYLKPYFLKYFPLEGKILEGGCGLGHYVIYYKKLGYDIIGVDFAEATVRKTKESFKDATIQKGDVRSLDFKDGFFKAYFSGGVIEHFKEGPDSIIKEANRVLEDKGFFIVTVPYINLTRRIIDFIRFKISRRGYIKTKDHNNVLNIYTIESDFNKKKNFSNFSFHEYAFKKREIHQIISRNGFKLVLSTPVDISWGIQDFDIIRRIFKKNRPDNTVTHCFESQLHSSNKEQRPFKKFLKKNIISEDGSGMIGKAFVFIMRILFGHMMLMVYEKQRSYAKFPSPSTS